MGNIGDVVMDDSDYKVYTGQGLVTITNGGISGGTISSINTGAISSSSTISHGNLEDFLETWIMNRVTIDHKVQEQELLKLKEVAPDYANDIKENLSKNIARDITNKVTFTKKHDKDSDVHHFIGRVWCFTEDELKQFIMDVRKNVI